MHDQIHLRGSNEEGIDVHSEQVALRHVSNADTNPMAEIRCRTALRLLESSNFLPQLVNHRN